MFDARNRSFTRAMLFSGVLSLVAGTAVAQTPPDNTKANKKDRAAGAVTADQQSNDTPDVALAAQIRKAIVDDKDLSVYAHNIKVIVTDGRVALKGPVRTEAEKKAIGLKADKIAGEANVMNNLTVAPDNPVFKEKKPTH
jgi:osmotically-inducible protein OsmY